MHPYAFLLTHIYLSDLRADADARHVAALHLAARREAARRAGPGRLTRLRRALASVSTGRGRSLDLPSAA